MTTYNKSSLAAFFETGDIPTGTDYTNLIDSCVNVAETSAQSIASPFNPTELITPRVSATNANFTGIVSADRIAASAASFVGAVSANSITALTVNANSKLNAFLGTFTGIVSAGAGINVVGDVSANTSTVYASALRSTNGLISGVGVVSAAGTAQATAATLTSIINRGKGIVDGTTTGFAPLANRAGLVQYLFNEGASANLWPPTGGTINGLAANAAFSLAASAMVTIVHLTASAYAVK